MDISNFLNRDFTLLDNKRNRLFLVLFILVFSVLFLNLFVPFNINNWLATSNTPKYIQLSTFGFIGSISIFFSQFLLRKWFRRDHFSLKQFILWVGFELFFITVLFTIFYGEIDKFKHVFSEFILTLKYTFLIALIPYSLVLLILSLLQSNSKLKELKKDKNKVVLLSKMISFKDEKGNSKFTFPLKDILYLESTDNYVYIHYNSTNGLKKELLRNSLKKIESDFINLPIKRCHRSYMINLENMSLIKRNGQKVQIKLKDLPNLIPVSKSYYQEFDTYF